MSQKKKAAFGIIAIIAVVLSGALFTLSRMEGLFFQCDNEIVRIVASPGEKLQAIAFTRDCGATTPVSYQVAIFPAESTFRYQPKRIVLIADGVKDVELIWENDRSLRIELAYTALSYVGTEVEGVQVHIMRKSDRPLSGVVLPPGGIKSE